MEKITPKGGSPEKPLNKLRILLVEDDADDYVIMQHHLARIPGNRFSLDWVTDYDGAMTALCSDEYDLCLLDYRLGARTGLELLAELGDRNRRAPIIFLTGQGEYEVDLQTMRSGAADYLVKEFKTYLFFKIGEIHRFFRFSALMLRFFGTTAVFQQKYSDDPIFNGPQSWQNAGYGFGP